MERAVLRGHAAKGYTLPKQIGVDEKAIAKGHQYMTLVCDLDKATVEYVGEGRGEENLAASFKAFGMERCAEIEAISLDMWPTFINACRENIPEADDKMVFDRFHIMRHVVETVGKVRKQEHKALMDKGDATLVKNKYLWLANPSNMPDQAKERFRKLQSNELKTGRPWVLKEVLRELWSYTSAAWALKFWKCWYYWVTRSRLHPMIEAARPFAECVDLLQTSHHQCRG